jgi:hypothetical protein
MIEITGDMGDYIQVTTNNVWDSNINNHSGGYKLEITVEPGMSFLSLIADFEQLKLETDKLVKTAVKEQELRENNPALMDLYEKYKVTAALLEANNNGE